MHAEFDVKVTQLQTHAGLRLASRISVLYLNSNTISENLRNYEKKLPLR